METAPDLSDNRAHHLVHDLDRDGWGSAALLAAHFGPQTCRLHPTRTKNVISTLGSLAAAGDTLWVLDIPGPDDWTRLHLPEGVRLVWVDHHLASWRTRAVGPVELFLPRHGKPTTTMSQLVAHGLVTVPGAVPFIRQLCGPVGDQAWGLAFDGLSEMAPEFPVAIHQLPRLIAAGPLGEGVPPELQGAVGLANASSERVRRVLDEVEIEIGPYLVAVRLDDARRIPLKYYSLALRALHPGKLIVIVFRGSTLYCGRGSSSPGIDLMQHFQGRCLEPKGHPYVCVVGLQTKRVPLELAALREAAAALGSEAAHGS